MAFAGKRLPALKKGQRINPGLGRPLRLQGTSRTRARGENAESYSGRSGAARRCTTVTYDANGGTAGRTGAVSEETVSTSDRHKYDEGHAGPSPVCPSQFPSSR